jgi:FeS assembly SUF system regulator
MLRISKITDYGTLVLVHLASLPGDQPCPATEVAHGTHLSLPVTQKILKILTRGRLVISTRGTGGGYTLAKSAHLISAADIVDVLEGPVAITECSHDDGHCQLEPNCQVGNAWQKISLAIRFALNEIKLSDLQNPPTEFPMSNTILRFSGITQKSAKLSQS